MRGCGLENQAVKVPPTQCIREPGSSDRSSIVAADRHSENYKIGYISEFLESWCLCFGHVNSENSEI